MVLTELFSFYETVHAPESGGAHVCLKLVARDLLVRHLIDRRPTLNVELFAVEAVDVRSDLCGEGKEEVEDEEEERQEREGCGEGDSDASREEKPKLISRQGDKVPQKYETEKMR